MKKTSALQKRHLSDKMNQFGFKFISSRDRFERKTLHGFQDLSCSSEISASEDETELVYHMTTGLGLQHKIVTDLMRPLGLIVGEAYVKAAFTIHRSLGRYFPFDDVRDRRIELRFSALESDMKDAAGRILNMLETDGLAWFERYSDLEVLCDDINNPMLGRQAASLLNNDMNISLYGVAMACLVQSDKASYYAERYLDHWEKHDAEIKSRGREIRSEAEYYKDKLAILSESAGMKLL